MIPSSTEVYYQQALARIQDDGFLKYCEAAATLVIDFLNRRGIEQGKVVDLGCGSGRLAELVSASGHEVTGVDLSPDMIRLAHERAPDAEFKTASVWDFDFPKCDCVTAIGEILNYRSPSATTPANPGRLFQKISASLEPGGLLLLDFATRGRLGGPPTRSQFFETDEWTISVESSEADNELSRRCIVFMSDPENQDRWIRHEETHNLELLETDTIVGDLERAGFQVQVGHGYGNVDLPHGMVQITASNSN